MDFNVIIPARFASQRLPGKPLLDIVGKSMVQRVYEQALKSLANDVVVAVDDHRVYDAVVGFGGKVCMTSQDHPSGTDRIQEVASIFGYEDNQIVVNIQGDEPLIPPEVINQVAANLELQQVQVATLSEPIECLEDFVNPNIVKAVTGEDECALYFSRAPVPWPRDSKARALPTGIRALKHLGIYAYRVSFLNRYVTWSPAAIEEVEKLEQLRILFHGVRIHTGQSCMPIPPGVDTVQDLQRVIEFVEQDG